VWRSSVAEAGKTLRANWIPFLLIQGLVVTFVILYYQQENLRQAVVGLGELRERGGYAFAAIAGALCGGVLPELAKLVTGRIGKVDRAWLGRVLFTLAFYAANTILVAAFYQVMALTVGTDTDIRTVVIKVLCDQFIFTPFLSIPFTLVSFAWFEGGFKWGPLRDFVKNSFLPRYVPTMLIAWCLWIPALFGVYSLPTPLQLPVSLGVLGGWSLLLVFLALGQGQK
jgi:hypothetical protein